jgi:D-alanyl-lipoteichoic acid acyltransferase DltB (MBOAT superfamily)
MMTMFLGGLWHGANWTFAFWGVMHGTYLVGGRLLEGFYRRTGIAASPIWSRPVSMAGMPVTFVLVCFTWVFFRAPDFGSAWKIGSAMLGVAHPVASLPLVRSYEIAIVALSAIVVFAEPVIVERLQRTGIGAWWRVPFPLRGTAYAVVALMLIVFGGTTQKFIYFDF